MEGEQVAPDQLIHWSSTTLTVRNIEQSIEYYTKNFGMTVIRDKVVTESGTTASLGSVADATQPFTGVALSLMQPNLPSDQIILVNGNVQPHRGFGHIAFNVDNVYTTCEHLEHAGVKFQKKPDEGRMKGLAFALDPDGYWVEVISRGKDSGITIPANLSQTMLRITDPQASLQFYCNTLGMTVPPHLPTAHTFQDML